MMFPRVSDRTRSLLQIAQLVTTALVVAVQLDDTFTKRGK